MNVWFLKLHLESTWLSEQSMIQYLTKPNIVNKLTMITWYRIKGNSLRFYFVRLPTYAIWITKFYTITAFMALFLLKQGNSLRFYFVYLPNDLISWLNTFLFNSNDIWIREYKDTTHIHHEKLAVGKNYWYMFGCTIPSSFWLLAFQCVIVWNFVKLGIQALE